MWSSLRRTLIGLTWLCAQFTTTLGVAKGRSGVRTALFIYIVTVMATYGYATYGYLRGTATGRKAVTDAMSS